MMVYYGVEGAMYEVKDGKIETKPEVKELMNTDREKYNQIYGGADDGLLWCGGRHV